MHVGLIADTDWLDEQMPLLEHLAVGLMDEQVRVTQIVPEGKLDQPAGGFGQMLTWRQSRWRLHRWWNLTRLHREVKRLGLDLIHGLDGRLWSATAELSRKTQLPAVFSTFDHTDVHRIHRLSAAITPRRSAFTAGSEPLRHALSQVLNPHYTLSLLRPGVHVDPDQSPAYRDTQQAVCAVIAGNGLHDGHYHTLLEGLPDLVRQQPNIQFFFDGQGAYQHRVWNAVRDLGLSSNASFIPRRLGRREMLLGANMLVHPQPLGQIRSLLVQAMARGLPIIAQADPWQDALIDDQTAMVLDQPTSETWREALQTLIDQPQRAAALGQAARHWVGHHRPASHSIGQVLQLYRAMTGQQLSFERPRAGL